MKILCVCGVGQGTSLLLKMNVSDVMDELGYSADVDNTDLTSANAEKSDFIVTNSEFAKQINNGTPIVLVENYFDKNEIKEKIKEFLEIK
ncbi:MAG: PTS sugar transporter subunit IIB [Helcococcus sp.]|nr:PTS sugar transporter subunit IIB [Helcococcus sp.]